MFDRFELRQIEVPGASLRVRIGGRGAPLLLLHGHPRTHTTWHRVAPLLSETFTVVCPDLRGFGCSVAKRELPDHHSASKREKGEDCIALMHQLGFPRFGLVGHDRGAYTAFRCAMDHPEAISKLALIDGIPIFEHVSRADARFAKAWWHWFFFAQPDKPERAINADPLAWYTHSVEAMGQENHADFVAAVTNPDVVHTMLEDYRAGLGIDWQHDNADKVVGRKLAMPLLALWSLQDDLEALYGDVLEVWRPWATEVSGFGIASGHHVAEEAPEALATALLAFFRS
jgi:haloacetate dehalogenase